MNSSPDPPEKKVIPVIGSLEPCIQQQAEAIAPEACVTQLLSDFLAV